MNLKEMKASLVTLVASAESMIESGVTAEHQADFDAKMIDIDNLKSNIGSAEKLADLKAPVAPKVKAQNDPVLKFEQEKNVDPMGGFHSFGEFAQCVAMGSRQNAVPDARFAEISAAAPTSPAQSRDAGGDGFELPPEMSSQVFEAINAVDTFDLMSLISVMPTSSNSVKMNSDETTPWGSDGIQAFYRKEATQMSESNLKTGQIHVELEELYAFTTATDEMLEDAPMLQQRLLKQAPERIRYRASESIMNGTGVGQPLGYLKSSALITVAKESGQSADTLDVLNISKMYSRMPSASVASAVWILNSSVLPQLLNLVIGTQPVYQAPMGFASAPFGTLLGRPIIWNDDAPTLGDANDIQFVDPRGYAAYRKQSGMKFDTSMHLFFDYGVQAFRWTTRFGGRPFLSAPITPANGPTKSTFIGLAERA